MSCSNLNDLNYNNGGLNICRQASLKESIERSHS